MDKTIKWAICGLGKISRRFYKAASSLPNTRIVACVSSSKERALKYQKRYGIESAYTYDELIANAKSIDAVYICNLTNQHAVTAKRFLEAGIPTLCEKPLSLTAKDAEAMISASRKNNVLLMEAMWTRFLPATLYLRELIKSGEMGPIMGIRARFEAGIGHGPNSRVFKKATGGGSIMDLGVYPVSYAEMFLGIPQSISVAGQLNKEKIDLCCKGELAYPKGVSMKFRTSLKFLQIHETCYIDCENGTIKIPRFYQAKKLLIKHSDGRTEKKVFEKIDGFSYEILHFNDLIRRGMKESPIMTHKSSFEVVKILETMNQQLGVYFD